MADDRLTVRYGTVNVAMVGGWLALAPEDDPPFWAVNLMKYRATADYGGDTVSVSVSGREADDAYSPLGPLAAVGAKVALHGDVLAQPSGSPQWDRVGIVNYPSRRAFIAMQQRADFKAAHVHKDAGMERTIVLASAPRGPSEGSSSAVPAASAAPAGLVMRVRRFASGAAGPPPESDVGGAWPVARLGVEGVIVGDERQWDDVCLDAVEDEGAIAAFAGATSGVDEQVVMFLRPAIDDLVATIEVPARDVDGGPR